MKINLLIRQFFVTHEAGVLHLWRGFLTSPHYRIYLLIFIQGECVRPTKIEFFYQTGVKTQ